MVNIKKCFIPRAQLCMELQMKLDGWDGDLEVGRKYITLGKCGITVKMEIPSDNEKLMRRIEVLTKCLDEACSR